MRAYVVMPCLNEEDSLAAACSSLGFSHESFFPDDVRLVLVDNGSTDTTKEIMQQVLRRSPFGTVFITKESERGFVPPRRHGVEVAMKLADDDGVETTNVLIVQADADTVYRPGYLEGLTIAAETAGPQVLLHARTDAPAEFATNHFEYQALCEHTDAAMQALYVPETEDVILDDKVCAFRLSDYLSWGGYRREYESNGEEIHAETSRLYLRGKTRGGRLLHVDVSAEPSRRKVLESPALYFATSGFPHGSAWAARWRLSYTGQDTFDAFYISNANLKEAIFQRQAHNLVLFGVLPAWIARSLSLRTIPLALEARLLPILQVLPALDRTTIWDAPGHVIWTALQLIEAHRAELQEYLLKHTLPL
jgi:glycosyltransferase involved in cell wall biosynthesis